MIMQIRPLGFQWQTQDPFLFCAYHRDLYPGGKTDLSPNAPLSGRNIGQDFEGKDGWNMYHGSKVPGFPAHPHCGFETITVVPEGLVDHSDSLGAAGRFGNGDTQWMTAGRGVQHSEMFPLLNAEKNDFELFQLWLNLPARSKEVAPHFKMLWAEEIPKITVESETGNAIVDLIAGNLQGKTALAPPPDSWAADPNSEMQIWTIKMEPNATFLIPEASMGVNKTLFYYAGENINIAGKEIRQKNALDLIPEMPLLITNGDKESRFLFLQGKPIGEPVSQHGPFVGNSLEGIKIKYAEFQKTQFGGWPWPAYDHTHGAERGRFAMHMDGTVEEKG